MRTMRRVQVTGMLGLILPTLWLVWVRKQAPVDPASTALVSPTSPHSPSAEARRAGWLGWLRAQEAVSRECEALEAWDPRVTTAVGDAPLRRQLLAADRSGDLGRAHMEAQRAAALARTTDEAYDAVVLLARLDRDEGDHQAELAQARRLMTLAPRRQLSLMVLGRAAMCNHLFTSPPAPPPDPPG
jgi:hypothetical protein